MSNSKRIVAIVLVLITVGAFYSSYRMLKRFQAERGDIFIQLADYFEVLALPYRIAKLSALPPDTELVMPVEGVLLREVDDTWGSPRSGGRTHKGVDIFASRGTPVYAVTSGFVLRKGEGELGGNYIFTIGAGGRRYYYAHLNTFAQGVEVGSPVTVDTVIGYIGNTGNASTTPPHLHFSMYIPREGAVNPFELLVNRDN